MLLVLSTFALFSSIFTVAKPTLAAGGLFFLLGSRMVVAAVILLGWLAVRRPAKVRLSRQLVWMVLLSGTLNFFLTNVFEFLGLSQLPSWKTCFIYNFSPFLSALLGYLVMGERLNLRKWAGLVIGCLGISLIFVTDALQSGEGIWRLGWPELSVLAAVTCSCLGWTLLRRLRLQQDVDPVAANAYGMLLAGLGCVLVSAFSEPWQPIPIWQATPAVLGSGYMLLVSNLLAYTLYASLLRRFSATFLALAGGSTSLFAALWGGLFLGESIDWIMAPAAVIGAAGLALFYREEIQDELRRRRLQPVTETPSSTAAATT
jgi:drug/metabolite transporter (DMT)-like permease